VQGNGGASDEDRRNGFGRGGWAMRVFDDKTLTFINETYQLADAFLFPLRLFERPSSGRLGHKGTAPLPAVPA
jgi:hypothetical protein